MNDARGYVKCALGFVVAILIVAGAIFGYDVKVDITDTNDPVVAETTTVATSTQTSDKVTNPADTKAPADTTPTEDKIDEPVVNAPIVTEAEQTQAPSQTTVQTKGEQTNA